MLVAFVFVVILVFIVFPVANAIRYSHSDQYQMDQRLDAVTRKW